MKNHIKLSKTSHASDIRNQLNSTSGLPFKEILSSKAIATAIEKQNIEYRDRIYSPDFTLWAFLSQVMSDDQSCQATMARIISFFTCAGKRPPSANTAAYSKARGRLPEELPIELTKQSGRDLEDQAESSWLWRKRHVKLIDGSTVTMPDTLENQVEYPQPRTREPSVGFPIARLVAIISCATGAVLDLALAPYSGKGTGEHGILRKLMDNFQIEDIVLGDSYYCSFFLMAFLMDLGVDAVFPMHGARDCDFRKGTRLGQNDHWINWKKPQRPSWMDKETYDSFPKEITVREVKVPFERKGFRVKPRILVTTFLDPKNVTKQELDELYDCRWLVEIDLRAIKQTMHMDILRGKTPDIVRKEIWIHLLAYNLIRKVMAQTASLYQKNPRQLSLKLALQVISAFRQSGIFHERNKKAYASILKAIAYQKIGNRPGRSEPRKIKRKPTPFGRLRKARHLYHQFSNVA